MNRPPSCIVYNANSCSNPPLQDPFGNHSSSHPHKDYAKWFRIFGLQTSGPPIQPNPGHPLRSSQKAWGPSGSKPFGACNNVRAWRTRWFQSVVCFRDLCQRHFFSMISKVPFLTGKAGEEGFTPTMRLPFAIAQEHSSPSVIPFWPKVKCKLCKRNSTNEVSFGQKIHLSICTI